MGAPTALAAAYSGDGNFVASSTSGAIAVSLGTSLVASTGSAPNPSTFAQLVTFSATVSGGGVTPTGLVIFSETGAEICRGTLSGGAASCTSAALAVGTHVLDVSYAGDTSYLPATGSVTQTVDKAVTTLALATSGSPSTYGGAVTFTATVTGPGGTPTGTVAFTEGATTHCAAAALSAGVATCTPATLGAGAHTITASSSGDGSYLGSTSTVGQTVAKATPVAAVVSSSNPSVYGELVGFTVTLTGVAGGTVPPGTVTFRDGTVTIGTGTLDAAGQATVSRHDRTPGAHSITVAYATSDNYEAVTSPALTQTVDAAPTHTALAVAPSPSLVGEAVTLTATVTADAPSTYVPGVTAEFLDGATVIGSATLDGTGRASISRTSLAIGVHTLTARLVGSVRYAASTSPGVAHEVVRPSTTTDLAALLPMSTFGDTATFRVTVGVTLPGVGVADGLVSIKDGGVEIGTVTLVGGTGLFATSALGAGTHDLTADYLGSADFLPSSSSIVTQVVDKAQPRVAFELSPNPSSFGQPVTLTATVTSDVAIPGGQVTFDDGAGQLATVTLDAAGKATFSTAALAAGPHTLRARYLGAADYKVAASAPAVLTVNKASTTLALVASPSPAVFGQPVTLRATVSVSAPGAGVPGGTVTFTDGGVTLGSATLGADGTASLTISTLAAGSHALVATYAGDASFLGASGSAGSHSVDQGTVLVTLTTGAPAAIFGQAVPFTVGVTAVAPAAGMPSGTVVLRDGATTLATLTLAGGTAATTVSTLAVGSHALVRRLRRRHVLRRRVGQPDPGDRQGRHLDGPQRVGQPGHLRPGRHLHRHGHGARARRRHAQRHGDLQRRRHRARHRHRDGRQGHPHDRRAHGRQPRPDGGLRRRRQLRDLHRRLHAAGLQGGRGDVGLVVARRRRCTVRPPPSR